MSYMCCNCKNKDTVVCVHCLYCENYEPKETENKVETSI